MLGKKLEKNKEMQEVYSNLPFYAVNSSNFKFWKQIKLSNTQSVAISKHKFIKDSLFVVLEYNVDHNSASNQIENFKDHLQKLSAFNVPFILSMYGYGFSDDEKTGYIYLPFSIDGDFQTFLTDTTFEKSKSDYICILLGLSYGLMKLEEKGWHPKVDTSHIRLDATRPMISFWENCSSNTSPDFYGFGTIMWKMCSKSPVPKRGDDISASVASFHGIVNDEYIDLLQKCISSTSGLSWKSIFEDIQKQKIKFKGQKESAVHTYSNQLLAMMPDVSQYFSVTMKPEDLQTQLEGMNDVQLEFLTDEIWHKLISRTSIPKTRAARTQYNQEFGNISKNVEQMILLKPIISYLKKLDFSRCIDVNLIQSNIFTAPEYICSPSDYDFAVDNGKKVVLGQGSFGKVYKVKSKNQRESHYYCYYINNIIF